VKLALAGLLIIVGFLLTSLYFLSFSQNTPELLEDSLKVHKFNSSTASILERFGRELQLGKDAVCSSNCYFGLEFNEDDIQRKLDIIVGHLIADGNFEWSTALTKTQDAFNKCYANLNSTENEITFFSIYKKALEIKAFVDRIALVSCLLMLIKYLKA
jgi:hypothetical protein